MKRKTPIRHTVRSHKREGKLVKSFERGNGKLSRRSKVIGVKTGMKKYSEGGWREYFPDGSYIWATYDRHYRSWCVTYSDKDGNPIGDAEYQVDRDSAIRNIKTDHGLDGRVRTPRYGSAVPDVVKIQDLQRKRETERIQREHWKKFKAQYPELKYDDVFVMGETAVKMKNGKIYRLKGEE